MSDPATYDVYLGIEEGTTLDHHKIWINTNITSTLPNGESIVAGQVLQVTGNIQQGMLYEEKIGIDPVELPEGIRKNKIGIIFQQDLEQVKQICRNVPAPPKQFDGPRRINSQKPLYRCQEWTRDAIDQLYASGLLIKGIMSPTSIDRGLGDDVVDSDGKSKSIGISD